MAYQAADCNVELAQKVQCKITVIRHNDVWDVHADFDCWNVIKRGLADQLDGWISTAEDSGLESFARSLHQDVEAVHAALTLPWSTGPVEVQINRLKSAPCPAAPISISYAAASWQPLR